MYSYLLWIDKEDEDDYIKYNSMARLWTDDKIELQRCDNEWLVSQRTASCLQTCLLFHDHDGWFNIQLSK